MLCWYQDDFHPVSETCSTYDTFLVCTPPERFSFFLFFWEFPAEWALGLFVPSWSLSGGWCACLFASAWSMGLRSDWGTSFSRRVSMQPYVHKGSPSRYRSGWVDWNTGHVTSWKGRTLLEALRSSYICICASYAYSYLLQGAIVVKTTYCY